MLIFHSLTHHSCLHQFFQVCSISSIIDSFTRVYSQRYTVSKVRFIIILFCSCFSFIIDSTHLHSSHLHRPQVWSISSIIDSFTRVYSQCYVFSKVCSISSIIDSFTRVYSQRYVVSKVSLGCSSNKNWLNFSIKILF
jgi:hypothetical protein